MNLFESLNPEKLTPYETSWSSPANIAFVKYWGKIGHQLPANPSLSMTLKECLTKSKVTFTPADQLEVTLLFEGNKRDAFGQKIKKYLEDLSTQMPWVLRLNIQIETQNTFPQGTGIASSASGLSAFALCLCDYLYYLMKLPRDELFFQRASFLSRLASGSACRSVYGGFTSWGDHSLEYATPLNEIHPVLKNLKNSILVISDVEKKVSSRAGHDEMNGHYFAQARFNQAKAQYAECLASLKNGNIEKLGSILESEALSLHAMMLTSKSSYTLFRPNTLAAIQLVRDFREQTHLPLYFTLDAGPNLHLIYPDSEKNKIQTFIQNELSPLAMRIIDDEEGTGPQCLK